ncbi:helix-turn-helix transcriptional regulator [Paenibacillus gallinarum]|uniref:Helix-turn-helix transcriptional regulator n=1 Tax=Paenibacillus gallinarum TaxID=2762232 RepID=A0ABR8SW28_9BACL|nr:helix-turn-helix transcriptional regulator [Paenibacillus gallinarum]MBD7967711.1 helix-turn-helix transcriptional regulator [Paenibacillus gallinarum]
MKSARREIFQTCRKSKGTQSKVASDLNISTVYVRKIENGLCTPGRDLMFKFSTYFNKPIEDLFPDYFDNVRVL